MTSEPTCTQGTATLLPEHIRPSSLPSLGPLCRLVDSQLSRTGLQRWSGRSCPPEKVSWSTHAQGSACLRKPQCEGPLEDAGELLLPTGVRGVSASQSGLPT